MRAVRVVEEQLLKETRTLVAVCGGEWESRDPTSLKDVHVPAGREKNPMCVAQHF